MTKKITLDLYTSHTQRPDPSNPRNNRVSETSLNCIRVSSLFSVFFVHKKVFNIKFWVAWHKATGADLYCVFGL